jgi:CheY-like chemotaxis protein
LPDRSAGWAPSRTRFLLVIAEQDEQAATELAQELARHHIDTKVCDGPAEALLAAGSLRPDAVLVAAGQTGITAAEIVQVLARRAGIAVVVGVSGQDGASAAAVLGAGATACIARPYRVPELIPILRAIRPDTAGALDPAIECGALRLDPAGDPSTGHIKRFLTGPRGAEITGVITTPDQKTMFVNVQHPGETTTAWGTPTPANPRAVSNWPDHDPAGRARSATLVIAKDDGGTIGS